MQLLKTFLVENDLKNAFLAVLAFLSIFATTLMLKRWALAKLEPLTKRRRRTDDIMSAAGRSQRVDELVVTLIRGTQSTLVFLWALFASLSLLAFPPALENTINGVLYLVSVLQISIWGGSMITFWIEHYMKIKSAEDIAVATALGLINSLSKVLFYGLIFLVTLNHFGVDITALLAGLGVGGIAVALAVKNILGDLLASLTIVLDKPFIVGDFVAVQDQMGSIERIGLKTTRIRSLTGEQLIFPNSDLLQSRLRNYKRMTERRALFTTHLVLETPYPLLKKVPKIIREIVEQQPMARIERSHLKAIGTFSFEHETVYWVKDPDYGTFMSINESIQLEILRRFRQEGMQFAYPTHSVYFPPGTALPSTVTSLQAEEVSPV